jgi:hypothetical protein
MFADSVFPMVDESGKKIILIVASPASFLDPYTTPTITVVLPAMAAQFHTEAVTPTPAVHLALMTSVTVAFVVFTVLCSIGIGT